MPIQRALSGGQAIALGTAIVGCADALDAMLFFGLRYGVPAGRIFQTIASGLLGQASYAGGSPTVALGILLHFTIACGIVTTYFVVSRKIELLRRRPVICGILYGLVAFAVMNLVVLPLSAFGRVPQFSKLSLANGLLIHAFGVGLPSALVASRTAR
jgi:hypothetical protein